MSLMNFTTILNLIQKANSKGLKIVYSDGDVLIKFAKGFVVDKELVKDLKKNKAEIIEYFKSFSVKNHKAEEKGELAKSIPSYGDNYYQVDPTLIYWLDDESDKKYKMIDVNHGVIFMSYKIEGSFRVDILKKAIAFMISRHESLRTTFHSIDEKFFMRVNDYPDIEDIVKSLNRDSIVRMGKKEVEIFTQFKDHKFDLSKDSLIQVRLTESSINQFVLSVKVHHIIFDGWSNRVFRKELFVSYYSFLKNETPDLLPLKYQLRDYTSTIINAISRNAALDKEYWENLYDKVPVELDIPCARLQERCENNRELGFYRFSFSDEFLTSVISLSKEHSLSMFIILQAIFLKFLNNRTSQNDIVIGTYITGREYPEIENQIGCFAKTVLIRTVFNSHDSLEEIIGKVEKSNTDMKIHNAYGLMGFLFNLMDSPDGICESFWKINLQFNDLNDEFLEYMETSKQFFDLNIEPKNQIEKKHISIDMSWDFEFERNSLKLKIDYNSNLYDPLAIESFTREFNQYAQSLILL